MRVELQVLSLEKPYVKFVDGRRNKIMSNKMKLVCFIMVVNHGIGSIIAQQSLRLEKKGDSCQVINFNCGGPSQDHGDGGEMPRNPGVPGKMGPVGPVGPKGSKGQTGSQGTKGEAGETVDVDETKTDILGMLSVVSCHELELRYGVAKTGYYLMREDGRPVYNYCDFNIYEGISNCTELWVSGKHEAGYYRFRNGGSDVPPFVYCINVSSCHELESRYGVAKAGYYLMSEDGEPVYNYCDFNIYEGISNCTELWMSGKHEAGYYRFRNGGSDVPPFVYCINYYTCEQLQKVNGTNMTGVYTMSPMDNPFQVHCTFPSGKATTEVWHSSMQEVKASPECEERGCYSWTPQYEIPESNILKVIENSHECRQFIKARCKGMVLLYNGDAHGWWVSRQGEKMTYWGGTTSQRDGYCACGETASCLDNNYKCNCDQNSGSLTTTDEGFLTDKSKLPVREIRLGDMGGSDEEGWHTLGKLECMG